MMSAPNGELRGEGEAEEAIGEFCVKLFPCSPAIFGEHQLSLSPWATTASSFT